MNVTPPDVASLRHQTPGVSQNPYNATKASNFSMNSASRPLGPPNMSSQNSGNIGPYASHPPHSHGVRTQGPSFGNTGPPNNAPPNHSLLNGQGLRPAGPNTGLGKIMCIN